MNRWICAIAGCALVCLVTQAEGRTRKAKLYQCDKRIDRALERYERGWYNDVVTTLQEVQVQCGGHSRIDTVTYYLGMALLRDKRPEEARTQFRRVVDNFPSSPYVLESKFRIGQCSYQASGTYDRDQTETRDAVRELSDFAQEAGEGVWVDSANAYVEKCQDKLARKEYENARFYYRIDKHDAAIVYFMNLTEEYPESKYVPEAQLLLAQSLSSVNRTSEAQRLLQEVVDGGYGEDIKRRARLQLARIEQSQ